MRIGMLSFAHHHAQAYLGNLRTIPGVEVIGLADEVPERGRQVAERFNAKLYPSYEALLAEKPDAVLVCSENARHRRLVEMAAAAGAHVFSEKPLATTLSDAQAMLEACDAAGVLLGVAFPMRFSAPMVEIKALLDSGGLGRVYTCNTTNQGQLPSHHGAWFVDRHLAGGGAVMDHTVHLADLLRWFLDSEVVEVYAKTNRLLHADAVDVETGGLIMLTLASGTFATIDCSWSRPHFYPTWGGLKMELVGERGVVNVDGFRQNLTTYGQPQQHTAWWYWGSDMNRAMVADFIGAIRESRAPKVTGHDGYKALEVALAAYASAERGQPVKLPLQD